MLQFKQPHDLKQLPEAHPAYPIVKDLVARLIVDGWIVEHPHGPKAASPRPWIPHPYPQPFGKGFKCSPGLLRPVVGIFS